jgi:hypothetical protein
MEFVGAVASVSLSEIWDKTDEARWQIFSVRADLREITLSPSPSIPQLAVVLWFFGWAQNSEITSVAYNVTVISNLPRQSAVAPTPGLSPATLVKSPSWDGRYLKVGEIVKSGAPNE